MFNSLPMFFEHILIQTPGKCFHKPEAAIKILNAKGNNNYRPTDRFKILPTFRGPDAVYGMLWR